jgi:uncharacterized protein YkwD
MRALSVIALAVVAALVSSPTGATGSAALVERRDALEGGIVRELNRVRGADGLRPLRVAPSLRTAARGHSRAMLQHGFFGHESHDGTSFSDRIRRHYSTRGWDSWSVGETLLASHGGRIDAAAVVKSWLQSPPHRKVIMSPTWRDAGIGVLFTPVAPAVFGGTEAVVVTADFGLRE